MSNIASALKRIYESDLPEQGDLEYLLSVESEAGLREIFEYADKVRKEFVGAGTLLRGVVEFSNICGNNCFYCGLNKANLALKRYRLSEEEMMESVERIAAEGIKTVVLQSGEDASLDSQWLKELIRRVKSKYDIAVTLSVGEKTREAYKLWRDAGADRYLLKIETSDKVFYESMHPGMSFENRLRCLRDLKDFGYETGSGNITGLKGQTLESIAGDIIFFKREGFEMIAVGPFISHPKTVFSSEPAGNATLTLKVIALTRIVTKKTNLPATSGLGNLDEDFREAALKSGANVLMLNFTPSAYRPLYDIYPRKIYTCHNGGNL
ncbi:MAG: [FeFe] hydrogenase H-cluster radical SAM maturase HydE [Candidatus Omnitrophota bacterium]